MFVGKLLDSLMMAKEAGHIPGIIGRLGDLGESQYNYYKPSFYADFILETFYYTYFTCVINLNTIAIQFYKWQRKM